MTVSFRVPGKVVSVNEAYLRAKFTANRGKGGGKGLILSPIGKVFKQRVNSHALIAALQSGWPKPETIRLRSLALAINFFGSEHDADAPIKLVQDSCEGALYKKDKAIKKVSSEWHKGDKKKPYFIVTVSFIEEEA